MQSPAVLRATASNSGVLGVHPLTQAAGCFPGVAELTSTLAQALHRELYSGNRLVPCQKARLASGSLPACHSTRPRVCTASRTEVQLQS